MEESKNKSRVEKMVAGHKQCKDNIVVIATSRREGVFPEQPIATKGHTVGIQTYHEK